MNTPSRVVLYHTYGPADVLTLTQQPAPVPGVGEVLVRIHASGLNPKDDILRQGTLRRFSGTSFPKQTGFDFSGTVSAVGPDVKGFQVGQAVWGLLDGFQGGAAADYAAVPQSWLGPKPENLSFIEAAALPLVGLTALQALRDQARLRPGERILIKGGSGGVGSAALQLAKAQGAHVTALASSANVSYCRELGADDAHDYATFDPDKHRKGFDVLLDCSGTSTYPHDLRLLRRKGRYVTVAPTPMVLAARLLPAGLPWPAARFVFVKSVRADLETLAGHVSAGELRMPIQSTYPLEQIQDAHRAVAVRHARGKRVLVIHPQSDQLGHMARPHPSTLEA